MKIDPDARSWQEEGWKRWRRDIVDFDLRKDVCSRNE